MKVVLHQAWLLQSFEMGIWGDMERSGKGKGIERSDFGTIHF
jgi:hypothetical protein